MTAGRSRWKRDYSLVAFESEHDSFEPSGEGTLAHAAADTPARENDPMESLVGYAESGEHSIAYQVTGAGDVDLVLVPGFISHLEYDWEEPRHAAFLERLGSFTRLIRFDKRGTGLSDRHSGVADLETRMDDIRAVMDAV